ncbi:dihydrolipoyl dehydrogenase [Salinibius halmophilus]|uniref:dihydrolipoyl dehydrogenase n=1 Tax=Salinibius halmophilus TaxID=1853216 RepID=UPI000E675CCC|nr:dihydrolipoyl dehydrogenase [Salinibius halmophilus]
MKVEVAVIGAGTAGLAAYREAAKHTDSVVLIEGGPHGTTCARVGCMPSKLLIAAADAAHEVKKADEFGVRATVASIDGRDVMQRVRSERDRFVGFVLEGVDNIPEHHKLRGYAQFIDGNRLQVNEQIIEADRIVIATGSSPAVPKPLQAAGDRLIINDNVFDWQDLPESVAVFGAGVIGLELGQALARLGVRTKLFSIGGFVGPLTDPEVKASALAALQDDFYFDPDARTEVRQDGDQVIVRYQRDEEWHEEAFDYLLAATGRKPNLDKLNLSAAGIELDDKGMPAYDADTLQIGKLPIFLAGDVNNDRPLLHEAADEGVIAGRNAISYPLVQGQPRRTPISVVFSDPQIMMVGKTYAQIIDEDVAIGQVSFANQGRSRVMLVNQGMLRVYGDRHTGKLIGAEMAGPSAEHIAHLLSWAIQQGQTVEQLLRMPFYHPVIEEGVRTALRDLAQALKN